MCYYLNVNFQGQRFNVFILDMPEYVYEVFCSYSNFKAKDLYCISKHNDYSIDLHHIGNYTYLL